MKTTLCLVLLGLIASTAFAAVTPSAFSATSASYNAAPVKVFDYANATTGTPDASITATSIWTSGVIFGPGATNATIYVWALKYNPVSASSSPGVLTAVIKRTLNATQIVNAPTDTTESAVIAADATAAITTTNKLAQDPKMAVCPGYFALAAVAPGTTYAASTDMLMLWYVAGTGSSATAVTVDTSVTVSAAGSSATYPTFAVGAVWAEDNVFYILYEQQTQAGTSAASTAFSPTGATQKGISLQGVNVTSGKTQFTAAVAVVSGLTISTTSYGQAILSSAGSGTNSSMSPTILVLWKDTSATKVMYAAVTKSTGTVATSATAVSAADVTYAAGPPVVSGVTSYPGGFIVSNYTYGIAISNITQTGSSAYTNGVNANYNGTTTSGGANQLATGTINAAPSVKTFPYGTGYAVVAIAPQTSGGPTYTVQGYFANGTMNGTSLALGSSVAPVSAFVDVNGGLWVGYYAYDTQTTVTQGPTTGYVGRVVAQTNYYNATSKSANVLATFAAILTFVIASLFMF